MSGNIENCCQNGDCTGTAVLEASPNPVFRPHYSSRYDQEAWLVRVALPGVKKEDVSVTVENDLLEIAGTRNLDVPEGWRPLGNSATARDYLLRLDVGPEVDEKKISGSLEEGVLSLRLPLRDEVKPRAIEIR